MGVRAQLALMPVLNALVAGNVVVLKPSELTPHMSALMAKLLPAYLDRRAIRIMEGAIAETTGMTRLPAPAYIA